MATSPDQRGAGLDKVEAGAPGIGAANGSAGAASADGVATIAAGAGGGIWRRAWRWPRAHRWLLGIVAAVVLVYALAGFLLVPWVARREAVNYVQRDLGRRLDIATIRFNPFTFTVDIRGLALKEADGAPILGFNRLFINAELVSSLLHWAWTFKQIQLEQPDVHLVVASDGTLNLARLAPPSTAPPPAAKPATGLPRLRVGRLAVINGAVHYEDHSVGRAFATTLQPIEFALNDFRTAPDHDNRYAFNARTLANETLNWAGVFRVGPLGSSGQFSVQGLRADTITSYLKDLLPLRVPAGTVNLDGTYSLGLEPALALTVQLAHVQLRGFAFAPKPGAGSAVPGDGGEPWIRLPALDVNDTQLSLADRRVAIGTIEVKGLDAQVWRERDGSINLMQLMGGSAGGGAAPATGSQPAAPASATDTSWHISLGTFALSDGVVEAEDRSVAPVVKVRLAPISVTVKGYSNDPGNHFDLDAGIGVDKGSVAANGRIGLEPFDTTMSLTLKNLELPVLQPYIKPALKLVRGRLGAKLKVVMAAEPARGQPSLRLTGEADVADLVTRDGVTGRDLITWQALRVLGLDFQQKPDHLLIRRVVANKLYGRVRIGADGKLNIAQVLAGDAGGGGAVNPATGAAAPVAQAVAAKKTRNKAQEKARSKRGTTEVASAPAARAAGNAAGMAGTMPIAIREILFQNSAADFSDMSVQPQFSSGILDLNGTVDGLSSDPKSRAQVKLQGKVDRYAPVTIDGQINLLSAVTYTDISMKFSNMDLTTFNPYSGKFAGYSIKQGKLSTELHYQIDNRKLNAQHHIVIDQLEFGQATGSKQAVPLPIKLAVALLKDRNGVITLDLPVSGSIDDPSFRIGPIIWKLFVGLLRKIVTAPFAALGALFGHGPDLAYVDFPAGSAMLPPTQIDKLKTLAKGLANRPQLKLQIPLETVGPADGEVLANAALDAAAASGGKAARQGGGSAAGAEVAPGGHASGGVKQGAGNAGGTGGAEAAAEVPSPPPGLPALVALYQRLLGSKPAYPDADKDPAARVAWLRAQLLPRFAPAAPQFMQLGRRRADAARDVVLMGTGVAPERVFMTETASGGGSIPAKAPAAAPAEASTTTPTAAPAGASSAGPGAASPANLAIPAGAPVPAPVAQTPVTPAAVPPSAAAAAATTRMQLKLD